MSEKKKIVHLICAARPNFMKVAPLYHALKIEEWCDPLLVHTGQHYDVNMSDVFFQDLKLPAPHIHLGVGSGSHAEQTGRVMIEYEKVCANERPDLTLVVGDVNATVACSMVAAKAGIPLAHLEAGLRSRDRTMPEEINRLTTDVIADLLLTPSPDADENLLAEGISPAKIAFVGNIMMDSLELIRPSLAPDELCQKFKLEPNKFALATFHRPSNVDTPNALAELCTALEKVTALIPVLLPLHPRTAARLKDFGMDSSLRRLPDLILVEPLTYREFISLMSVAQIVITDSGGIQEETTYLGVPCLTCRENTERPITITEGTNELVDIPELASRVEKVLTAGSPEGRIPSRWDGQTASRVTTVLKHFILGSKFDSQEIVSGFRV